MRHAGSSDGLVATASLTHFPDRTNIVKSKPTKNEEKPDWIPSQND